MARGQTRAVKALVGGTLFDGNGRPSAWFASKLVTWVA